MVSHLYEYSNNAPVVIEYLNVESVIIPVMYDELSLEQSIPHDHFW
jgi:hypothetical protein